MKYTLLSVNYKEPLEDGTISEIIGLYSNRHIAEGIWKLATKDDDGFESARFNLGEPYYLELELDQPLFT